MFWCNTTHFVFFSQFYLQSCLARLRGDLLKLQQLRCSHLVVPVGVQYCPPSLAVEAAPFGSLRSWMRRLRRKMGRVDTHHISLQVSFSPFHHLSPLSPLTFPPSRLTSVTPRLPSITSHLCHISSLSLSLSPLAFPPSHLTSHPSPSLHHISPSLNHHSSSQLSTSFCSC